MNHTIRSIDLQNMEDMLKLLSLQMAAYLKEAEMIGLPDIPPLLDSPDTIRESGESFYGCYKDEELIGAISVMEKKADCAIRRLMVRPDRLRQGVGTFLIRFVLEAAAARNKPVSVRSAFSNYAAISLYRRLGFNPCRQYPPMDNGLVIVELYLDKRVVLLPDEI